MDPCAGVSSQSHPDFLRHPGIRENGDEAMPEAVERPPGELLLPFSLNDMGSSPARRTIWLKRIDRPRLPLSGSAAKYGQRGPAA